MRVLMISANTEQINVPVLPLGLARVAAAKGLIAPGADLLRPVFYLEPDLDGWLQEKAARMVEEKDHWHN